MELNWFDNLPVNPFDLFQQRRSVRAYLSTPVSDDLLAQVMTAARLAPSGANLQPGVFLSVRGAVRQRLSEDLALAWREGRQEVEDYDYFPQPMPMTLRRRQVAAAQALYGALGVARDNRAGRDAELLGDLALVARPFACSSPLALRTRSAQPACWPARHGPAQSAHRSQ